MINDAIILVNPSHRIGCIVKLSKKYNFTPICVLTMGNSFAFDYEQNFNNIKKLNNHVEVYRTYENGTTPNELSAILKSKYNVQAVVPYEEDLKYAEELASVLGVAGNDVSTVNIRKDKYNFNELLSKNSVRSVKQMMIEKNTTADDVVKYFNNTFPIVIKPIDGVLSVSVYICKNENEVHDAINGKNTFMSKFVAQEFIDGNEYIVNFITYKNKHHLTNICVYDRRVVNGHVINFGYQYITKQDDLFNSLMNYGINVLNASKVNCGTTHLEIKIDKKGPVLIECNWRIQGGHDFIDEPMIENYPLYELSLFSYWPTLKQSKELFENYSLNKLTKTNLMVVSLIAYNDGHLNKYTIMENKKLWPSFKGFEEMVKEGRDFVKTIDYSTVLGEIQLSDEDIFLINKDRENILHAEEFSHELLWI